MWFTCFYLSVLFCWHCGDLYITLVLLKKLWMVKKRVRYIRSNLQKKTNPEPYAYSFELRCIVWRHHYIFRCSSPSALAGKAITGLSINEMTCPQQDDVSRYSQLKIGFFILASVILLIILTLIVIWFRHVLFPCKRYSVMTNEDDMGRKENVRILPDMEQKHMIPFINPDVV